MKPKRIQRKRTKGWRMPEGAVYVGRPTKWGNPFVVGELVRASDHALAPFVGGFGPSPLAPAIGLFQMTAVKMLDHAVVINAFVRWFVEQPHLMLSVRDELGGHDLACWCPLNQPCHADVLLELANTSDTLYEGGAE